jgi:hypothetical protein
VSRSRQKFGTREWEQDIYLHVSNHGRVEGEILDEYESLMVDETLSPAFSYLARIILEDEVRHHRIFDDLAETMGNMATDGTATSPVPSLHGFHTDRIRIQRVTERLLEVERADLRELKDLSKRLKGLDKVTLWGLLIELMVDDTKKHIKILEFIRDRSKDQPD